MNREYEESMRRIAALEEHLASLPAADVIGVVESVAGFGPPSSAGISIARWRDAKGVLQPGSLYVRVPGCDEEQLLELRRAYPDHHVVHLRVRPDQDSARASTDSTTQALFVETLPPGDEDAELEEIARQRRAEEASRPLGRPAFDPWWLLFEFLARFVRRPDLPVVHLGGELSGDAWRPSVPSADEAPRPRGHEVLERVSEHGRVIVTVVEGRIRAVTYDYDTYRETGIRRMRKLQTLLAAHGEREGEIHRTFDTQHGAMFYSNQSGSCRATYAYNSDRLIVRGY